jgi:hypothetical protein
MRIADDGGFRHRGMADQRRFDFRRAHAVTGDVEHVIDATGDPVIAVVIAAAAVTGEILALVGGEIGLDEALVIAVDRPHLAGPAVGDAEIAVGGSLENLALVVDQLRLHAEERLRVAEPGFRSWRPAVA